MRAPHAAAKEKELGLSKRITFYMVWCAQLTTQQRQERLQLTREQQCERHSAEIHTERQDKLQLMKEQWLSEIVLRLMHRGKTGQQQQEGHGTETV